MKLTPKTPARSQPRSENDYILVVDDLADNLFLLKAILEAEGYRVEVASNGRAALAKAEARPPNLMLLDVMMPDMSGYEVTQRLRQNDRLSSIPVMLITAYNEESAEFGKAIGADEFIRKPFDFDELIQRVRAYAG